MMGSCFARAHWHEFHSFLLAGFRHDAALHPLPYPLVHKLMQGFLVPFDYSNIFYDFLPCYVEAVAVYLG